MKDGSGTVFVLGAGFTRAFLPQAPLLVDDYDAELLKRQFAGFPDAVRQLEIEIGLTRDESGRADYPPKVNLERLMTRLSGGMPYDFRAGVEKPFGLLLSELKRTFGTKLRNARENGAIEQPLLQLFAGFCVSRGLKCITFNYDDLLDEALWQYRPIHNTLEAWSPDWGYGFPCRMSESCVRDVDIQAPDHRRGLLLKLHGSLNWRVPHGQPKPHTVEAIRHHERWFEHYGRGKLDLGEIEPYLEVDPVIVPPVLTKSELNEQPVLRLCWDAAIDALMNSNRVVFLGYSLPITDIAAGFLFREGLGHLKPDAITVVDFARDELEINKRQHGLLSAYRNVFPQIEPERFEFCGAVEWVRENLVSWLYDSRGKPIAYNVLNHIISRYGGYLGTVRGYGTDTIDIWHGTYTGEIVDGNRLVRRDPGPEGDRGGGRPPPLPTVVRVPKSIGPVKLPDGFRDLGDDELNAGL